jgi:outer membrane lipoprotein-sorting protein
MNCECENIRDLIADAITGVLPPEQAKHLDEHLSACVDCRNYAEALRREDLSLTEFVAGIGTDMADRQRQLLRDLGPRPFGPSNQPAKWRRIMRSRIAKLAVAAVMVLAVAVGIHLLGNSRPAFADVVRPILTARTATFKMVIHVPDQPMRTWEGRFLDPGLIRYEMGMGDNPERKAIQIIDFIQGKSLVLVPAQKMAMVLKSQNQSEEPDPRNLNMFREFRDRIRQAQEHPSGSVEYVGASQVAGHEVVGYRLLESGVRMTIWADARSLLPVQIEYAPDKGPASQAGELVMTDIQFDVALDPGEFSLAVPPGYTEQTVQVDASTPNETDLVETLRFWTQTAGKFPPALDISAVKELREPLREQGKTGESGKPKDLNDPAVQEFLRDFMKIIRGLKFVQSLPPEADWHYAGPDATVGDATKPIFWYRPQGSATYRVIYADLSVLDVAFEDLPE